VVAHSFGCAAVTLALRDGFDVERLVFVAPPVDPETYTRRFGAVLGLDAHVVEGMKQRIERRFHRKWTDYSVENTALRMTAPLLVIHDTDDREIPVDGSRRIVESWPSSRLMVTSGLGHRRILRDELVTQTVSGFLR
jgi:pimeloyl-ACP methyl ester carboxylesterase